MYDQAARSFGFNPVTARRDPEQHAQVETRMYVTINAAIDVAKAKGGKSSSVEWHSQFRSLLGTERLKSEKAETLKLNQQARLASLPGASTLADPALRGVVQTLLTAEKRLLALAGPEVPIVAEVAGKAGAMLALLAAEHMAQSAIDLGVSPEQERKQLTPLALSLDTDNDGKLMCREIGEWKVDRGNHSANSRAYQDYVSGRPGTDFNVKPPAFREINFDGCTDRADGPVLLEAKGNHGGVLDPMKFENALDKIKQQGIDQDRAAKALGAANEWHVQTDKDHVVIKDLLESAKLPTPVFYDPTPVIK